MNNTHRPVGPASLHAAIWNHSLLSELILLVAGIVGTIILDRIVRRMTAKHLNWLYERFNRSIGQISKDTPSVKVARGIAILIPNWMWQFWTWTLFVFGYVSKSMSTWSSTAVYVLQFAAIKYWFPTQKLMLDLGWVSFELYQSYQLCQRDYQKYVSLGGGGTPQTWNGFKRITLLGWFGEIDTLEPPPKRNEEGFLEDLEQRFGERPRVTGIAPQRQLDQRSPTRIHDHLLTYLDQLSAKNSSRIYSATSFLEKHSTALRGNPDRVKNPDHHVFGCEIAHPHGIDGSLHCMLHPNDIEKVIRAGWGERHSIARADCWWMWWFFTTENRPPIPVDLCFIYAPRTEYEVVVVADVVEAGVKYVTCGGSGAGSVPLKGLEQMD